MAFTEAEKKDIRKYLGVPFAFYDLNHRLESSMDHVGSNATDSAEVSGWLTRLAAIDTALTGSGSTQTSYGTLKKVDEVEFYPIAGSDDTNTLGLVEQGQALVQRLSRALGVWPDLPIGDYFDTVKTVGFQIQIG